MELSVKEINKRYKKSLIPIFKELPDVLCEWCGSTRKNKNGIVVHKSFNIKECFENNKIKEINNFVTNQMKDRIKSDETLKKILTSLSKN